MLIEDLNKEGSISKINVNAQIISTPITNVLNEYINERRSILNKVLKLYSKYSNNSHSNDDHVD